MGLYDRVADLPLTVEGYDLERHERETSSAFTRVSTVVVLDGADETGRGEDVTYDAADHDRLHAAHETGWSLNLAGEYTVETFSRALDDVTLFPEPPESETARHYRRWALESAALDLALRQADTDLASALGRQYDPVRFVVSTRLGEAGLGRIEQLLAVAPDAEFKLDPTDEWDDDLVAGLLDLAGDRVRVLDFKGHYEGTDVDAEPDPDRYRRIAEAFPDAVIEDPAVTDETAPVVESFRDRVSFDAPVTGVESVEALPVEPRWLNVKPSRFGTVESLLDTIEYCQERDVRLYGGGQFELSVGREHVQALASLCYPDGPNDVAPGGYNDPEPAADLPTSPLSPPADPSGLAWH
ncbi:MAG: hypothetical protein ABEJ23_06050 [Haloarculaceae archaeon]